MLDGLAASRLLGGVRGAKPTNRKALAQIIEGVSRLVTDFPEIRELDLNPVFASDKGAVAADVRVLLDAEAAAGRAGAVGVEHEEFGAGVLEMNAVHRADDLLALGIDRRRDAVAIGAQVRAQPRHHQAKHVKYL